VNAFQGDAAWRTLRVTGAPSASRDAAGARVDVADPARHPAETRPRSSAILHHKATGTGLGLAS